MLKNRYAKTQACNKNGVLLIRYDRDPYPLLVERIFRKCTPMLLVLMKPKDAGCPYESFPGSGAPRSLL